MSNQPIKHYIPNISVLVDLEQDINRFSFFLNSPEFRRKRLSILNFYPSIADKIGHGGNEEEIVRDVVVDMYRRYEEKIDSIVTLVKKEFSESESVFTALAKYMAFPQLGEKSYTAIPTFLPFSPLNKDLFFFSIAQTIAGREMKPLQVVSIGVHEISHFIFFDQVSNWSKTTGLFLNYASTHYFKEAWTAAIMDQLEFREFFDYPLLVGSEDYSGNSELHQLFIDSNGKSEHIVAFFKEEILRSAEGYTVALDRMLHRFVMAGDAFVEKWKLWNNTSPDPEQRGEFVKKYSEPIKI